MVFKLKKKFLFSETGNRFQDFMNVLGDIVLLKDFQDFSGGLDTERFKISI